METIRRFMAYGICVYAVGFIVVLLLLANMTY
jgi:hypothetical protein